MQKRQESYVHTLFQSLHKIPESAMQEYKTSALLAEKIAALGYDTITNVGQTGIIAVMDSGVSGPVIAMRADMDALVYQIGDRLECRHTCGHDAHSAMLLATAKTIAERKIKTGKFIALFQPGEEPILGALAMIASKKLDSLGIEELYGIHLRPVGEMSVGSVTPALYHSASGRLKIHLHGKSAANNRPDCAINAVEAAILAIQAINTIHMDPTVQYSIKTTHMNTCTDFPTQIPAQVKLIVDLKHQDTESYAKMKQKAIQAIEAAAETFHARAEIESINYVPGAAYDKDAIETARQSICEALGEKACLPPLMTSGGDDFHYLARHLGCKSAFLGLGADASPGLHHQEMTFNPICLDHGVRVLTKIVENRLGLQNEI